MALSKTQVSQLYVSVFGRASEGEGNTYWQTDAASTDMVTTANVMLNTDAAKTYFGDTLNDNQKFIEHVYENTLGKTYAEDKEGVDYWVSELAGGKSKGEVIAALIDAAQATANAGDAQDQFNNKVAVSDYTADTIAKFTTTEAFTAFISGVTHETSTVDTAKTAVDAAVPAVDGQTYQLTTAADLITGTDGDDTLTGYVGTNPATGVLTDTFQSVDVIDAGDGTDTLSVSTNTDNANIGAIVKNVENIVFTDYKGGTTATPSMNMANMSGVKTLTNTNSIADFVASNVAAMDFAVTNVKGNTSELQYGSSVYAGSEDSATITLNNATDQHEILLTGNDIETLNVKTETAESKVDFTGTAVDGTTKMVITGDQKLSFDDDGTSNAMAALKTLDASAFTGKLDADLSNGGAVDLAITGGTADDKVKITNFTKDDVVDLGEGDDTLNIVLTADVTTAAAITNVETLGLTAASSYTVNLDGMTSITQVNIGTGSETVTLQDVQAATTTVAFTNTQKTTNTVDNLSYTLEDGSGTEDKLTLAYNNVNATTGEAEDMTKENTLTQASLIAAGIEDLTISTANLGADDTTVTTNKGGLIISSITATDLRTLTVSSSTYVDLDASALDATVGTVNAADASGGIALDISAVAADYVTSGTPAVSITTGAGNDTLGSINGDVKQTITTGAGKDTLTLEEVGGNKAMAGVQTISLGAGNDTVTVTANTGVTSAAAGSKLDFGADTDTLSANVDAAADIDLTNITISNLEKVTMAGSNLGNDLVVKAANLSGKAVEVSTFGTSLLQLAGTASADTIDASTFTINGSTGIGVEGKGGADTITGTTGNDTFAYGATIADSNISTTTTAAAGFDTVTVTAGDIFDFNAVVTVFEGAEVNSGVALGATGTAVIGQLDTAFKAADDGTANVEAMIIDFTGGEQFLVVDSDTDQAITAADNVVKLVGTVTAATDGSNGNVAIA